MSDKETQIGVEIPFEKLSREALEGLVEAFVLREGTDYGDREWSLAEKMNQVIAQLRAGTAVIVFEEKTESCTIIAKNKF